MKSLRIYDVTVPITEVMPVWPGGPRVKIEKMSSMIKGDAMNVSSLSLGCHTGTHVDAPFHFVRKGKTVDKLPLDVLMGTAYVAEMDRLESTTIGVYDLASFHLPRNVTRLLIKTTNSHFWEDRLTEFERDFVHLSPKAARWLVKRGIELVGVDYLSVEAFGSWRYEVHNLLLGANVIIIEGLNLSRVQEGWYKLICLPLKIQGGDGAPARVLVVRE